MSLSDDEKKLRQRQSWKKWYDKKGKDWFNSRARRRTQSLRDLVASVKNLPCVDCGVKYPHYVMQFDHLRDKDFNISEASAKGISIEKVLNEISKCEVVCANCHAIRTWTRTHA